MNYRSLKNPERIVIQNFSHQNKQNQLSWLNGENDICKILSKFNTAIQDNKKSICQLQIKIDGVTCNNQCGNYYFRENSKSTKTNCKEQLNETNMTLSKPNSYQIQTNQLKLSELKHKIQQIAGLIRRKQIQNSFSLQERLSQKGQKSQIQKAINLSKLLVIQIQQIKDRFRESQTIIRGHEIKFDNFQRILQSSLKEISDQNNYLKQNKNKLVFAQCQSQSQIKTKKMIQNIKENLELSFKESEQRLRQQILNKFQIFHKNTEELGCICPLKGQSEHMNCRVGESKSKSKSKQSQLQKQSQVQKQSQLLQKQRTLFQKQVKKIIKNVSQQTQKQSQKLKRDYESFICRSFQSFQKTYARKADFQSNSEQVQGHLNRITQNLYKLNTRNTSRMQGIQRTLGSLQIQQQKNMQTLDEVVSRTAQGQKRFSSFEGQIEKSLQRYVKTQTLETCLQSQNQKVYNVINANFLQQKLVNSTLCSQNILGRWIWQGQVLKGGNLIAWDKQVVNTLPQNFRFSPQKSNIIEISSSGIYKFELGFYGKNKPTIQIIVNGQVVMSAVNSSSYVLHHSSGKLKGVQPTQIAGLTLVDFFLIPQHSRVAIAYNGDLKGQGFLNIHRL